MSALDFLHGVDVLEIIEGARPIRTVKASVIGLVGTAGKGPVNTPVLLTGNERVAVEIFGANGEDGFSIPAAIHAIFQQGGATVIAVNVMENIAGNKTAITAEVVQANGYAAKLAHPFVSSVVLSGPFKVKLMATGSGTLAFDTLPAGATPVSATDLQGVAVLAADIEQGQFYIVTYTIAGSPTLNTDYTVDANAGIISIVPDTSSFAPGSSFSVAYSYLDPTKATDDQIVGEIDSSGTATGAQCFLQAKALTQVQPRMFVAPGYTHQKLDSVTRNPVVDALNGIASRLRGIVIADCPNTTKEAAVGYMQDWGNTPRVYGHYPFYRVLKMDGSGTFKAVPASPFIAGVIARTDNDDGFWFSPSNRQVFGIVGVDKPVDFSISDPSSVSNYLNLNAVTTTIYEQGLRLWGNRVGDMSFISGRRTADMVEESILLAHLWAVDRNINRGYLFEVVEGVNAYLRILKAQGAILGGKAWADPTLNTVESLADGHVYIDFEFTRPVPAEHLTFRTHLVNDYFADIFDSSNTTT